MSGKLNFGCDYLFVMRELIHRGGKKGNEELIGDVAARMFLLNWGLTIEEIDKTNSLFWEKANNDSLGNLIDAVNRIISHVNKDQQMKERLVIELAAIGHMDFEVTDEEDRFVSYFQTELDFKPSEFRALTQKGIDWSIALNFLGDTFVNSKSNNN